MSMLDEKLKLDGYGTALTATRVSGNYINTNAYEGDIGVGGEAYIFVQVDAALTSAGSSTLTVTVETDDNSSFASPKILMTTGSIAKAALVKGYVLFNHEIPSGAEKYIQVRYTVGTADFTAGSVKAYLMPAKVNAGKIYPSRFNNASA